MAVQATTILHHEMFYGSEIIEMMGLLMRDGLLNCVCLLSLVNFQWTSVLTLKALLLLMPIVPKPRELGEVSVLTS